MNHLEQKEQTEKREKSEKRNRKENELIKIIIIETSLNDNNEEQEGERERKILTNGDVGGDSDLSTHDRGHSLVIEHVVDESVEETVTHQHHRRRHIQVDAVKSQTKE